MLLYFLLNQNFRCAQYLKFKKFNRTKSIEFLNDINNNKTSMSNLTVFLKMTAVIYLIQILIL